MAIRSEAEQFEVLLIIFGMTLSCEQVELAKGSTRMWNRH